jgi:O-antigen biosynthesis protein
MLSTARKHWERNPEIASRDQWTSNPVIGEIVYSRMSGGETSAHWLGWLIQSYFRDRRFSRVLSPGCGTGGHEVSMMAHRTIDRLDAFDFSESSLELARRKAVDNKLKINFYIDDINTFTIPKDILYDMIICSGSLHHVREIERFFRVVRDGLQPNGVFVFNEYVGPCYNVYPKDRLKIINRLLKAIAPELRHADHLDQTTVEQTLAIDSSESVRSSLILPFVSTYFDFELRRPFGGTLLHPLYPLLDHREMSKKSPERESLIRLLMEFEQILIEEAVIETDFILCVCRKK